METFLKILLGLCILAYSQTTVAEECVYAIMKVETRSYYDESGEEILSEEAQTIVEEHMDKYSAEMNLFKYRKKPGFYKVEERCIGGDRIL